MAAPTDSGLAITPEVMQQVMLALGLKDVELIALRLTVTRLEKAVAMFQASHRQQQSEAELAATQPSSPSRRPTANQGA